MYVRRVHVQHIYNGISGCKDPPPLSWNKVGIRLLTVSHECRGRRDMYMRKFQVHNPSYLCREERPKLGTHTLLLLEGGGANSSTFLSWGGSFALVGVATINGLISSSPTVNFIWRVDDGIRSVCVLEQITSILLTVEGSFWSAISSQPLTPTQILNVSVVSYGTPEGVFYLKRTFLLGNNRRL